MAQEQEVEKIGIGKKIAATVLTLIAGVAAAFFMIRPSGEKKPAEKAYIAETPEQKTNGSDLETLKKAFKANPDVIFGENAGVFVNGKLIDDSTVEYSGQFQRKIEDLERQGKTEDANKYRQARREAREEMMREAEAKELERNEMVNPQYLLDALRRESNIYFGIQSEDVFLSSHLLLLRLHLERLENENGGVLPSIPKETLDTLIKDLNDINTHIDDTNVSEYTKKNFRDFLNNLNKPSPQIDGSKVEQTPSRPQEQQR